MPVFRKIENVFEKKKEINYTNKKDKLVIIYECLNIIFYPAAKNLFILDDLGAFGRFGRNGSNVVPERFFRIFCDLTK